jgi:hypothetical protein
LFSSLTRYNRYKQFCHGLYFLNSHSLKRNIYNYRGNIVHSYYFFSGILTIWDYYISFSFPKQDNLFFYIPNNNYVHAWCVGFHLHDGTLCEVLILFHEVFSWWDWKYYFISITTRDLLVYDVYGMAFDQKE